MISLTKRTLFFAAGAALLALSCAVDNTRPQAPKKVDWVGYNGPKCVTQPLAVDTVILAAEKSFCDQDKTKCFDGLVQLRWTTQKDAFSFLILSKAHRERMSFIEIENVLSEAHNSKRNIQITYIQEAGKLCSSNYVPPLLLETELISLEIIK